MPVGFDRLNVNALMPITALNQSFSQKPAFLNAATEPTTPNEGQMNPATPTQQAIHPRTDNGGTDLVMRGG